MSAVPRAVRFRLAAWQLRCEAEDAVQPFPSKNLTLVCRSAGGRRVLVKAADSGSDRGVAWEGKVLALLTASCDEGTRRSLPRVRAFDERRAVLALDWLPNAETLHSYHRRTRRYAVTDAAQIGRGLGALHAATSRDRSRFASLTGWTDGSEFIGRFLWLKPALFASLAAPTLALIASVQADADALHALRELHDRAASEEGCLVHGDLRQANVVRTSAAGRPRVVFLDWELSCWGDPARDVGSLCADYALGWLCPMSEAEALGEAALRRFLRSFLAGHRAARTDRLFVDPDFERRTLQWAGEALLRYAFTLTCEEGRFDERGERLTTWGKELLARPERWLGPLLGAQA